jgi:hypothetical protein
MCMYRNFFQWYITTASAAGTATTTTTMASKDTE